MMQEPHSDSTVTVVLTFKLIVYELQQSLNSCYIKDS